MRIVVCGSGTGLPSSVSSSPSVLVSVGDENLLLDMGPGAMRQLAVLNLSYHDIDKILLTHTHIDHIGDLMYFLFVSKYEAFPRRKELQVVAPKRFENFLTGLTSLFGAQIVPQEYKLSIVEVEDTVLEFKGYRIIAKPTRHILPGVAFRIEENGKSFVYTGDTELTDEIVEIVKEADLLITECSFPDELSVRGHMSPGSVAELIRRARPKKTLLVHVYPLLGQEKAVSSVRLCLKDLEEEFAVDAAYDFLRVELF
ncbi:MAG: MBL fold metallo-hydrolase [Planctomycetota bacterium]|nr:MBL fold metallo-hydrolase [Planctomycetota bacterium]